MATLAAGPVDHASRHDLFLRIALTLNSTLDLGEVLKTLAGLALEATLADRCSLFLLEESDLIPAVSLARRPDDKAWEQFQDMAPLHVADMPGASELLQGGGAVHIPRVSESALIPPAWIERFDLNALVIVPLRASGHPCGVMAIDSKHGFSRSEVATLEAIGTYAGVAVRNARSFDAAARRARYQKALADGASALVTAMSAEEIVEQVADSYLTLLGADVCAIGLLDREGQRLTTITSRGPVEVAAHIPLAEIPPDIIETIANAWRYDPGPVTLDDAPWLRHLIQTADSRRYLMLPIRIHEEAAGAVLLGVRPRASLDEDGLSAATALAALAATALERSGMGRDLERRLRCVEILHDLSAALQRQTTTRGLIAALNRLLVDDDVRVLDLELTDKSLSRLGESAIARVAGRRARWIVMKLGRKTVGRMRVATLNDDADMAFLEAVANGVAEVAARAVMRLELEDASRERAVVSVRECMAADLHDTAGQIFVGMGLIARRHLTMLPPDSEWAARIARYVELSEEGKWEIDQAIRALSFFPAARRGLIPSLEAFSHSFEIDSGVRVIFDVEGDARRLEPELERALYRVAHEALTNSWRHARASVVRMQICFDTTSVKLIVIDDGIGLSSRNGGALRGVGTLSMRKAMLEAGGDLRLRTAKPRGARVEATAPLRRAG
jgi:signal transduction histidine kinase